MHLYEITNGYIGESYVRAYAWAKDEAEARALYEARHGCDDEERSGKNGPTVRLLFSGDSGPFVTDKSDSGWPG